MTAGEYLAAHVSWHVDDGLRWLVLYCLILTVFMVGVLYGYARGKLAGYMLAAHKPKITSPATVRDAAYKAVQDALASHNCPTDTTWRSTRPVESKA